eukprot:GEMP01053630.1.p1 GENE.GEMP01053630.1~~GEMP01053630.1.p1  ORF type:complete len:259 (+),score=64.58 GEMP01053630.1:227-1003(+)
MSTKDLRSFFGDAGVNTVSSTCVRIPHFTAFGSSDADMDVDQVADALRPVIGTDADDQETGQRGAREFLIDDPPVGVGMDIPCESDVIEKGIDPYNAAVHKAEAFAYHEFPKEMWDRVRTMHVPHHAYAPSDFFTLRNAYDRARFLRKGISAMLNTEENLYRYDSYEIGTINKMFRDIEDRARFLFAAAHPCYLKSYQKTAFLDIDMTEKPPVVLPEYQDNPACPFGDLKCAFHHTCAPAADAEMLSRDLTWHVPYGA